MKLGIDFKAIATKVAGHAGGAFAFTQLNKAKFMRAYDAPEKQAVKGAIAAAIGYVVAPILAKKMGLAGKGTKGALVESVGEGLGIVGVMLMGNALIKPQAGPALFPVISGVDDTEYDENQMAGIGEYYGNNGMSGYEQDPTVLGVGEAEAV
jgi:hypothetical protein